VADIACAGAPTQFTDESTTGINSNVIAWSWDFGNGGTASSRNPLYVYDEPGLYEVSLSVTTSAGCTDTFVQEVLVESPVTADFTAQSLCPSEATPYTVQFNDASSVSGGEVISEWLWTINGENFVIADPSYTFSEPGTYQVSLTVFSESFCNASVTRTLSVAPLPQPSFGVRPNCAGQPVSFTNQTPAEGQAISAYRWTFGPPEAPLGTAFVENPDFVFEEAGSYPVRLEVETAAGCLFTYQEEVSVPPAPRAGFTASRTYGGAPLTVDFGIQSSGADTYVWDFGGAGSSTEASPSFTFDSPGEYRVQLRVGSALACADSVTQLIEVVEPVTDLQLSQLRLLSAAEDTEVRLLLTLRNRGTVPMQDFPIQLTVGEQVSLRETYEGVLEPGATVNYPLSFSLTGTARQRAALAYVCATLGAEGDVYLSDNRACASLESDFTVIDPFPNPTQEVFEVAVILPEAEAVQFQLITTKGELLRELNFADTQAGLNNFALDVSELRSGTYFLQVSYRGRTETHRLMVGP